METSELFDSSANCCGCGSCVAKCPADAINLKEDSYGFLYPQIDKEKCVNCRMCAKSCGLHAKIGQFSAGPFYAAAGTGNIDGSASAGLFISIARIFVNNGGVVYGVVFSKEEGRLLARHSRAISLEELQPMQNSKYVQSYSASSYSQVLSDLKNGLEVLYSGTPCQVAGLKGFLGRDWTNLTTIDLVCHGVPSQRMFDGMVEMAEAGHSSSVEDVRFRSKRGGWNDSLLLQIAFFGGEQSFIPASDSPYYDLFLHLKTLRDSCYSCPYGGRYRAADITIGDFWGVEKRCPEILMQDGFSATRGVSCLLVNTSHGGEFIKQHQETLYLYEVSFEDIATGNDQLRYPSVMPEDRDLYLEAFSNSGWPAVVQLWKRRERGPVYRIKQLVKAVLPDGIKRKLKKALGKP